MQKSHGFSVFGALKYPADFTHLSYVNPDAPKGGDVKFFALGTFDSLNPYILKGVSATAMGLSFDSLLKSSPEEVGVAYGLLAKFVAVSDDKRRIRFYLHESAKFHDNSPVTAHDVKWTFDILRKAGHPVYKTLLRDIDDILVIDDKVIEFILTNGNNREMPLIIGSVDILSKQYWADKDFDKTTLHPPLGSGPYIIKDFDEGRRITYQRNPSYWGRDLPVNRGLYNFDSITYDYYRDQAIGVEAFKAGEYDIRNENTAKFWATSYDVPAVHTGKIIKREFKHQRIANLQAIYFNLRNPLFADKGVRRALNHVWDFEWVNKNIMYDAYQRRLSYFDNHVLSSKNIPLKGAEYDILKQFEGDIPPEIFANIPFQLPVSDGGGNNRDNLRIAHGILKENGWQLKDGILHHAEKGLDFKFEFLLYSDAFTAHLQPMVQSLKRLGIDMSLRIVDSSQYQKRLQNFDYDMTMVAFRQTDLPGNEQRTMWGSLAADEPGSNNIGGVKNKVIDALIEKIIVAKNYDELTNLTRALDRVLLWNWYTILTYGIDYDRIAYWNKFSMPAAPLPYQGVDFNSWWVDESKMQALDN